MRTDSNRVLSLSSDTPSNVTNSSKPIKHKNSDFDMDYNKAKESIEASDTKALPSNSVSASTDAEDSRNAVKVPLEKSGKEGVEEETNISHEVGSLASGGKELQSSGDKSPPTLNSSEVFTEELLEQEEGQIASTVINASNFLDGQESDLSPAGLEGAAALSALASQNSYDEQTQEVYSSNILAGESLDVGMDDSMPSADYALIGSVANEILPTADAQIIEGRSEHEKVVLNAAPVVSLSESSDVEPLDEITFNQGKEDIQSGDELSWVLSQMKAAQPQQTDSNLDSVSSSIVKGGRVDVDAAPTITMSNSKQTNTLSSFLDNATTLEVDLDFDDSLAEGSLGEEISIDEPLELRKKDQEVFLARMAMQSEGKVNEDSASTFNASLGGVGRVASSGVSSTLTGSQANLMMNVPPNHPAWAAEMSQKVAWIAREGGHTAHIRLDPPELGSLAVKISVDHDSNTQVSFVAATPQARDLLEGQMNRLRDMLAQQGMDLSQADVDVSQQDTAGTKEGNDFQENRGVAQEDSLDEELFLDNMSYVSESGVDFYA